LTVFQIQDAADDPLTRTAALCSLVSALMSLSYGIMYIIRFANMRSMYRASRWAEVNIPSRPAGWFLIAISLIHLSHVIGGSKDRNGHLLECLGLASPAWSLARLVRARVRRCNNVVRLAHGRQRRLAPTLVACGGVWSPRWDHLPAIARSRLHCTRHTDF
jgi:hypothetical protein